MPHQPTETQAVSPSRGVSPARWTTNAASASSRTEHAPHAAAARRRSGMLTAETHAGPLVWPPLHEQSPTPNGARHAPPAVVVKDPRSAPLLPHPAAARVTPAAPGATSILEGPLPPHWLSSAPLWPPPPRGGGQPQRLVRELPTQHNHPGG
ncbi:hypothetical protein Pelo_13065 [Pelomyxa schiedti]|nr:hypothetical protein Pelo_13065 [Pelomyxa schiedti]